MYWRPIDETDLEECLAIEPRCIGAELTGRDIALGIWRRLLDEPSFHGSVYESDAPVAGHRIQGCGIGVFVDPAFADRELAQPAPGLNARIIGSIAAGRPVILDRDAIAAGNAGTGLDYVNLYGAWREDLRDPDLLAEVQTLLGTSFVEKLAGFRFNRVLKEAVGQPTIALAHATGTYRLVAEFPGSDSALFVVSPESSLSAPFSVAARMYRYEAPVLRLRQGEQELLAAALDGATDADLSAALGISLEAVKKRWISIFTRVGQFRPGILAGGEGETTGRGPQKRHRVIAYVRSHREELRPYAWSTATAR